MMWVLGARLGLLSSFKYVVVKILLVYFQLWIVVKSLSWAYWAVIIRSLVQSIRSFSQVTLLGSHSTFTIILLSSLLYPMFWLKVHSWVPSLWIDSRACWVSMPMLPSFSEWWSSLVSVLPRFFGSWSMVLPRVLVGSRLKWG